MSLKLKIQDLHGLSELYKKSYEKIEKEKKEILKKVKAEGEIYLENVNKKVEKVIKNIRESGASKEIIKESKKIIQEIKFENKDFIVDEVEKVSSKKDFAIGDFVGINNSTTLGKNN